MTGGLAESTGGEYDRSDDLDRVVFFSDAVFAIAMTVLALSLHIPARTTDAGVAQALRDALPSIYTYALSFAVVGLYWIAHHRMFRYIRRFDATLLALNLATLGVVRIYSVSHVGTRQPRKHDGGGRVLRGDHGPPRRLGDAALGVRVT